jgi:predicted phage terminase large subunit-like protein
MTLSRFDFEFILKYDLTSFIERAFYELNPQTTLISSPHLEVIASKLEGCLQGKIRRLIINLPPRSLKSHCVTIAFPAFLLGHNPAAQIICASYGQDLADKHARDCRTLMGSSFYRRLFPQTVLSAERQAVNDFMTTRQGFRMATSVGGVLTGRGGELIILDDPLKPEDALSETKRSGANDWYDNTLISRLNSKDNGVIIIVMQRLHQDDLVGHVQQGEWDVLSFPAIAQEDEAYRYRTVLGNRIFTRKRGEALQPERESLATLDMIRRSMGEYNFESQYQQNPIPLGGAMVKTQWLKYYAPNELAERFDMIVQSWDTANKPTELSDYSVCTTWGLANRQAYLLYVFRARLNYPDLKRKVKELAHHHGAQRILVEDKASGTQLIQDLQAEHIHGITPYVPPTGTDKIMRLHTQTHWFENGNVLLPRSAPWLADYVIEVTGFPGAKYDDQVDSTTQALNYMRGPNTLEIWRRLGLSAAEFRSQH